MLLITGRDRDDDERAEEAAELHRRPDRTHQKSGRSLTVSNRRASQRGTAPWSAATNQLPASRSATPEHSDHFSNVETPRGFQRTRPVVTMRARYVRADPRRPTVFDPCFGSPAPQVGCVSSKAVSQSSSPGPGPVSPSVRSTTGERSGCSCAPGHVVVLGVRQFLDGHRRRPDRHWRSGQIPARGWREFRPGSQSDGGQVDGGEEVLVVLDEPDQGPVDVVTPALQATVDVAAGPSPHPCLEPGGVDDLPGPLPGEGGGLLGGQVGLTLDVRQDPG